MSFVFFCTALILYYFIHSFLADENINHVLQKKWISPAYFRLVYNGIAIALLIPLIWWYLHLPSVMFWEKTSLLFFAGWILQVTGLVVFLMALKQYNLRTFSGWEQLQRSPGKGLPEKLQTSGLNGMVRHPLYFGSLLLLWGFFLIQMHVAAFLVAIISTIYIFTGTRLEERKLQQQFGQDYQAYRRKVPMLWPNCLMIIKNVQRTK